MEGNEKILRVEGTLFDPLEIVILLEKYGNVCVDFPIDS